MQYLRCRLMTNEYLSNLPAELLHLIFHYCDAKTIFCSIGLVCKRLRAVVYQYNQVELRFSRISATIVKRTLRHVPRHAVESLILSLGQTIASQKELYCFISGICQFEQLRNLSIRNLRDEYLQMFSEDLNYTQLVTLEIVTEYRPAVKIMSLLASMTKKLKGVQKFSLTCLNRQIEDIPSLGQCNITHLTIGKCFYNEYLAILHHLPSLKTLQLNDLIMNSVNDSPIVQLTCLTIRNYSLTTEHLKFLLSKATVLRHLKLAFSKPKKFKCFVDVYNWEEFVRTELNFLDRLEFFISYELPLDVMVDFESFVMPFQKPF